MEQFHTVVCAGPNFHLTFKASNERIGRVLEVLLKEAVEAEAEYSTRDQSKHISAESFVEYHKGTHVKK